MINKINNKLTSIDEIVKKTSLLDEKNLNKVKDFGFEDISMPEFPTPEMPTMDDINDCDKFLEKVFALKETPTNIKHFLQIQARELKQKLITIYRNMINQLVQLKELITNLWKQLKQEVKKIIDEIKNAYKAIITYFNSEFTKIKNLFKKLKKASTSEERELRKKQIKEEAKKYGGEVLEMLGIITLYDTLKELWFAMKNMWGMAKSGWKSIIDNFKNLKSLLKDCSSTLGKSILAWIILLLPIVSQLALAVLGAIELSKKQQKIDEEILEEALKNIEQPIDNKIYSELLLNAINNQKKINKKEIDNKTIDSSCFSICPVEYDTNGVNNNKYGGYILEMGTDIDVYRFVKNVSDTINIEDVIGYINNTPIKSKIEGVVSEKKERYIIVKPNEIDKKYNLNISVESQKNKFTELSEAFNDISKIENILKDDILYIYKTILYNNFIYTKNTNDYSLDTKYNSIIKKHEDNISNLEKRILEITSKKNIKNKMELENGLLMIKDDIMNAKDAFFENIINTFNKENISTYPNKNCDYKLLDFYYNFIMNFNYDEENVYKVEFLNMILSFINSRIDLESFNKNEIITTFNKKALEITTNKNYFNKVLSWNDNNLKNIYENIKKDCNISAIQNKEYKLNLENEENINNLTNTINSEDNSKEETLSKEDKEIIEKDSIAKSLSFIFYIYNNIKEKKSNNQRTESEIKKLLKKQTNQEYDEIKKYFNNIIDKYYSFKEKANNIDKFFDEINWPTSGEIYIDNTNYTHYIFRNNIQKNDNNNLNNKISKEDGDNQLSTKTKEEPSSYLYWLRYCGMATLVNCALPMYWGTGIVIAGAPVPLPIILVPIYVLNGSCICVFGLGICGIAIWPMILYSNLSVDMMSYLAPVNVVIDLVKNSLNTLKEQTKDMLKPIASGQISILDTQIKNTKKEINDMKKEISLIKSM